MIAPSPSPTTSPSRLPHRLALVLVGATFPLIWVGGLVTTTEAGMAVPDYPGTFGYNMLLYPWTTWIAGPWDVFVEHGHRLFAVLVGLIAIGLAAVLATRDERSWMRRLGLIGVVAVTAQGLIGGARVLLDARLLAMIHGCTGPLYFAFCVALAHFTSPAFRLRRPTSPSGDRHVAAATDEATAGEDVAARLYRLALVTTVLAYVQLVLGALVRHMPVEATPGEFRAAVLLHLLMAAILTVHVLLLAGRAALLHGRLRVGGGSSPRLRGPALLAAIGIFVQLLLGATTWIVNYGYPQWVVRLVETPEHVVRAGSLLQVLVTTAHVAVGSLILATATVLVLRTRLLLPRAAGAVVLMGSGLLRGAGA